MPDPFIVGPTGLPVYLLQDWRDRAVERWRQSHGPDVPVDPTTPDGFWIDMITLMLGLTGDATQSVYANSFFRTSNAPALDMIVDLFGRARLAAKPTEVDVVWYGTAGTLVYSGAGPGAPVSSVVSATESNLDRYETKAGTSGTIPIVADDQAVTVIRINDVKDTNDYMVDIAGVETTAITTAGPADTVETIAVSVAADILADQPDWILSTPGLDPLGRALIVIDNKSAKDVTVGANITNPLHMDVFPAARLAALAEVTGPQVALAGTVITIETPAAGLEGVTTTADGLLGRDLETDTELRRRHIDQINSTGKCTPQSIRAALLEQLPSPLVEFARVDESLGPVPFMGIPVHAYQVTVIGTATDQQVGDIIWAQRPAGVRSYGDIEVSTPDELDEPHRTFFSRGTEQYLHLFISLTAGEGFPIGGDPLATVNAAVTAGLLEIEDMGQDIYRAFAAGLATTAVPGIKTISVRTDVTAAPGDAPAFMSVDVIVPTTEVVRTDSARITVVMV